MIKATLTDRQHREFVSTFEYNKQGRLVRKTDYNGLVEETVFDDKGRELKKVVYNIADPTARLYDEKEYDEKGTHTATLDERGERTEHRYSGGNLTEDKLPNGGVMSYGYDSFGSLKSISSDDEGEANTNKFGYTLDFLTSVSSGGNTYKYTYDGWGRKTKTELPAGDRYEYKFSEDDNGATDTITYCNTLGAVEYALTSKTDKDGKLLESAIDGAVQTAYTYNDDGMLMSFEDKASGLTDTFVYDKEGNLTEKRNAEVKINTEYEDGKTVKTAVEICGTAKTTVYAYSDTPDQKLTSVTLPNGRTQEVKYDGLGRTVAVGDKEIYYAQFGDRATSLVSSVWYNRNDNLRYKYDKTGNISEIRENGKLTARYEYDSLNRLVKENDTTIEYDNNGNIMRKGDAIYCYAMTGDRDRLLSFDGKDISYDVCGRPTTYLGKTLSWTRRNLISYDGNTYTYNAAGIRTSKTSNGVTTKYFLDGDKILAELCGSDMIIYRCGVDGIAGFEYNGIEYVYRRNIQGDITHIYTLDGKLQARYTYDAWGNHKVLNSDGTENTATAFIGNINPLRYRGYYYDAETGLYYITTRYYDPATGRFINADDPAMLLTESSVVGGANLYSYCYNNPIMFTDHSGNGFFTSLLIAALIGMAIGGTVGGVTAAVKGDDIWGGILSGALVGGALGASTFLGGAAFLAIGANAVGGIATATLAAKTAFIGASAITALGITFGAGVGAYAIKAGFNNEQFHVGEALVSGFSTMLKGAAAFTIGFSMASGGAYNFLLPTAAKQTLAMMITGGVLRGTLSTSLTLIFAPWRYGL